MEKFGCVGYGIIVIICFVVGWIYSKVSYLSRRSDRLYSSIIGLKDAVNGTKYNYSTGRYEGGIRDSLDELDKVVAAIDKRSDLLVAAHQGKTLESKSEAIVGVDGFLIGYTCPLCEAEVKTVKYGEKLESETYECSCGLNLHIKSNIL